MANFHNFAVRIQQRFNELSQHELFTTVNGDDLWSTYLAAFPEGTNPLFRERTEHDCSCCRNFIRNVGNVVALIDDKYATLWDVEGLEYPYNEVAQALHKKVCSEFITGL